MLHATRGLPGPQRNAVLSSVLEHTDPRPWMKGYHELPPFVCPGCKKEVTPELEASDAEELAALSAANQKKELRTHSKGHFGAMRGQELVLFMDNKYLHRRTNTAHNNVLATFMLVPFDREKRRAANEALEDAGAYVRFPVRSEKKRMPKLGNGDDARILHSNPTLLVRLFEIFYEEELTYEEAQKLLPEQLCQVIQGGDRAAGHAAFALDTKLVLESGNRNVKTNKKILFWGGTDKPGTMWEQSRSKGKH